MNKYNIKGNLLLFFMGFVGAILSSCSNEPSPDPSPYVDPSEKSTILIYAVATNSLSTNLISDKNEMLTAGEQIDLKKNDVLLFETRYNMMPRLLKLVESPTAVMGYDFEVVKEYSDDISSLDPIRIREVLNYVSDNYISQTNGLIFWSHSTGAQPFLPETRGAESAESITSSYSFGQDKNQTLGQEFQINVDELADAIPDNFYDFIWFDSCYMSNIESVYEFRDKCNYFIGYPTEDWAYGMPYDLVLPQIARKEPNLIGGAELFFNYYAQNSSSMLRAATIAVIDMKKIETLADYCSIFMEEGKTPSTTSMMKYTRFTTGPFYDLGDYTKSMATLNGVEIDENEWNALLDDVVVYRATTKLNFDLQPLFDPERFSGLSAHIYSFTENDEEENYYKSLDWYSRVFK